MKTLKVLIVEDSQDDVLLMVRTLERSGYSVTYQQVQSSDEMKRALSEGQWEVILADYTLPNFGAISALNVVKEVGSDIPFIVVTGTINDELAVTVMKAGASDYIMKDRLSRLAPAIERELREAEIRQEQKQAKTEIGKMLATLATITELLPDIFYIKDVEGRYQTVNAAFEKLTRKPKSMILGRKDYEVLPEGMVAEVRAQDIEIQTTRKPYRCEQAVATSEGIIHYDVSKVPLISDDGQMIGIVGFNRDVTALRSSEGMLKSILDNIGIGIAVISPQMEVLSINNQLQSWNSQIDFSHNPFCYEVFNNPPQDSVCSYCPTQHTLKDGLVHEGITATPFGNETRHYRIKSSPIRDEHGVITAAIEMVDDITEQVRAQEEIRKLSVAIEQSPSPIIITDTQGRIEYVNSKFTAITGYSLAEVFGKTPAILKSGTHDPNIYTKLWQTITAGREFVGEIHNKTKDGQTYWALASISPIRNTEDKITHYLGIQQDITERKQFEKDLRDKNAKLEEALTQLKDIQVRLIQQEKLAGIGQLAAGVAHEINNPLGFVVSNFATLKKYLDRLRDMISAYRSYVDVSGSLNAGQLKQAASQVIKFETEKRIDELLIDLPEIVADSSEGLERVSGIVKGLRLFSRIDSGQGFGEYDLNGGLDTTMLVARNEIKYAAEIKTNLTAVPMIEAIGSEVNQVLLNIIVNAAQAIREKNLDTMGLITVSTRADDKYVYCDIVDNGIGITPGNEKKIFEPFFTTKAVGQGTGLGLSISYDIIVNKHRGDITMKSQRGVGTVFTVMLPIRQSAKTASNLI